MWTHQIKSCSLTGTVIALSLLFQATGLKVDTCCFLSPTLCLFGIKSKKKTYIRQWQRRMSWYQFSLVLVALPQAGYEPADTTYTCRWYCATFGQGLFSACCLVCSVQYKNKKEIKTNITQNPKYVLLFSILFLFVNMFFLKIKRKKVISG